MRKPLLFAILFALSVVVYGCGGGGSGSASLPAGEPTGVPAKVQLEPSQFVAQTNGSITLNAKVLDGNGQPVQGVQVRFSNAVANKLVTISPEIAVTNQIGIATARASSSTQDFITIEVETQSGQIVRDARTVYFSAGSAVLLPTLTLEVCGNDNNGICNEPDDLILFQGAGDNQVNVVATVFDRTGERVPGVSVTFGSDDTAEVTFPTGTTRTTDINGEASVLVKVVPIGLTSVRTVATITADADNGAFNATSLFLQPVTISSIIVTAAPSTVDTNGTSTISAGVKTSLGAPAPDGTTVNFEVGGLGCDGAVTPFGQTTGGVATAQFTAPGQGLICTVTAMAGTASGSTNITVVEPPTPPVTPTAVTVVPTNAAVPPGGAFTFLISGGVPPYRITADKPTIVTIANTVPPVTTNAGQFEVKNTYTCGETKTTVVITVLDSADKPTTATANYVVDCTL